MDAQLNSVRNRQFWTGVGATVIAAILVSLGMPTLYRSRMANESIGG